MKKTVETLQEAGAGWRTAAVEAAETPPDQPFAVVTGEALELAYRIQLHWDPIEDGKRARPGLSAALLGGLITERTADEIIELVHAVTHEQAWYRQTEAAGLKAPVDEGEYILQELKVSLGFIFDDGQDDLHDAELARLSESHSNTQTHDALAVSLEGFAVFANRFRDRLAELPEFDPAIIDEAVDVAHRLREQSALAGATLENSRQRGHLQMRNALITLLEERVSGARRAARYVFRHHPAVASLFTSEYDRRMRLRARAAKKAQANRNGTTPSQEVTP
jgi:hypothetical protein